MPFNGYGRGWQEPKAEGRFKRFLQVMREPATKYTWYIATATYLVLMVGVMVAISYFT